jgi:hypothetical protein
MAKKGKQRREQLFMELTWFVGGLLLVLAGLFFTPAWVWSNLTNPTNNSACLGCYSNEPVKIEAMIPTIAIVFGFLIIAMSFDTKNGGEKNAL